MSLESTVKDVLQGQYGFELAGFSKAVRSIMKDECGMTWPVGFIPDAYEVLKTHDGRLNELRIYEIEDTNPISQVKLRKLVDLWWFLDATMDRDFRVFVLDRYGLNERELPIMEYAYSMLPKPGSSNKTDG